MIRTVYIYEINRIGTKDSYVGSTFNWKGRFKTHKADLIKNKHPSHRLQNCWNKYGKDAFAFNVLVQEDCNDNNERRLLELEWIKRRGTLNTMIPDETNCFFTFTPEQVDHISKKAYELWADPVWAAKCLEAIRETAARPESIEHLKRQSIRVATDPIIQKKWRATRASTEFKQKHRASVNTENSKKLVAQSSGERWKDPVYAEHTATAISEAWTPQRRKEQSLRTSAMNEERKQQPPNLEAIAKMTATRRKQEAAVTKEERLRRNNVTKDSLTKYWKSVPEEVVEARSQKISSSLRKRSPEEKAATADKRWKTRRANAEAKKQKL